MSQITTLMEQAARAERLAWAVADRLATERLLQLSGEYRAQANALRDGHQVGGDGAAPGHAGSSSDSDRAADERVGSTASVYGACSGPRANR